MKRLLWPGLLFLSVSWLFFLHIFYPPDLMVGLVFLLVGIFFVTCAFWKHKVPQIDTKYLLLLVPLVLPAFIISFPFNLGVILLLVSGLSYVLIVYVLRAKKAAWVSLSMMISGMILAVQSVFIPLYFIVAARYHQLEFLSPLFAGVGRLFGLQTSANQGMVFVQTVAGTYAFTTTLEKLGFFLWLMLLVGALLFFVFLNKKQRIGRNIVLFLVVSGGYLIVRYISLLYVYISFSTDDLEIFWDPVYMFISFIPLVLLFVGFLSLKKMKIDLGFLKGFKISKQGLFAVVSVLLFMFSAVGAYAFQDPGEVKQGRVLVDEMHSDWEDSTQPLDKDWYGKLAVYNFYNLVDWLDMYYDVDRNLNRTIDAALLDDYDVLIVKCPTTNFSEREINNIVRFVEQGGGLYLIGDHTNVFGMNFYLNQIAKHFGIVFRYDAEYDLENRYLSIYRSPKLLIHPIMQYTPQFDYLSSCTLKAPMTAENVMIGYGLLSSLGTYSTEHFFRTMPSIPPDVEYGVFLQTAAVKHGQGRVVAFTDSTCFSNYCVFMDGYPSFNLMTMQYLNRSNAYSFVNIVFVFLAFVFLGFSLFLLKKKKRFCVVVLFLLVALVSFAAAAPLFSYVNQLNYRLPERQTNVTRVCFVDDFSDFSISSRHAAMPEVSNEEKFNTFFVWTQRVGCVPSVENTLDDAMKKGDIIVIINPDKSFTTPVINDITEYANNGGKVLLMDGVTNEDSTANELLRAFDMSIQKQSSYKSVNNTVNGTHVGGVKQPHLVVYGGERRVVDKNYRSFVSVKNHGDGMLVVLVDSYSFSNAVMGGTFTVPNDTQQEIYNTEFYVFEELLFGN